MKKILSTILVVLLIVSIFPMGLFCITANAATIYKDSEFEFIVANSKARIVGYTGSKTDLVIPSTVTHGIDYKVQYIGDYAFDNLSDITSVTIPYGVTWIGSSAFSGCTNLTSVTIPKSVTSIDSSAFSGCTNLTSVTIPNSITTIAASTFAGCESLTDVTISDSVTIIGDGAFDGCESLKNVYYYGTSSQWENIAIRSNNSSLTNAKIYYHYGQEHSFDLMEIVTAPTCENVGSQKYTCSTCGVEETREIESLGHNYSNEYTVDVEPTCYADGSKSRHCSRCDSQIDFTVIPAINHIDKRYCYEYEIVSEVDKTIKITKYLCKEAKVEIPATIDGYTVIYIGESAFAENSAIISVEIPDTVKSIGENAFFLSYNLTKIVLPEGLKTIAYGAFSYCSGLINIRIPDSVIEIGASVFSYCSSLEQINIPSKITHIRKNTFRSCDKLTRVIVPDKVEIIDEYAFAYCSSLVDIWLPISIDVICENAFSYSNVFSTVYYAGTETEWNNITIADKKLLNSAQIHYNISVEEIDSHWQEYSIDATCTVDGEYGYECPCGCKISTIIPALEHEFDEKFTIDKEPTYNEIGSKSRHCSRCDEVTDVTEIPMLEILKNGWISENGKWAYYENGVKAINTWKKDSIGWCFLGDDGYCVTNCWKKDSIGWCYLDANGRMVYNNWVYDSGKWYFIDANGYMVSNCWKKDSKGWCYLGSSGAMLTNAWVKDSVGWCYIGADGYCVTNKWVKDSKGWCYLDSQGRMVYNKWVKDSIGWCYVGSNGYMVTSQWVKYNSQWYYLNANGYMATGTKTINGKTYKFNSSGVWIG